MQLLKSPSLTMDQLWSGVKPVLQSPFALTALKFARRNPKTLIALGIAGAGGALLAALLSRSARKGEAGERHRARQNGSGATYAARQPEIEASAAMTQ
jgi:hypothetical protein